MSEPSAGEHKHRWWWNEDEAVSGDFPFVCEDGCDATIDGVEVLDILNDREALLRDKAALEARLEAMAGELLHAYALDETASDDGPHGEQRSWNYLTDEQRTYWIATAQEEKEDE